MVSIGAYFYVSSDSSKAGESAIKSALQVGKAATNIVPSKEDYQKASEDSRMYGMR